MNGGGGGFRYRISPEPVVMSIGSTEEVRLRRINKELIDALRQAADAIAMMIADEEIDQAARRNALIALRKAIAKGEEK